MMRRVLSYLLLLSLAAPVWGASPFGQNEMRAALIRDRIRLIWSVLRDGSSGQRRLKAQTANAFQDETDARSAEAYDSLRAPLLARARNIELQLDKAMAANDLDDADGRVRKQAEVLSTAMQAISADYDFYVKLPGLTDGPRRGVAKATMRLLVQTGSFPIARAYFTSRGAPRR